LDDPAAALERVHSRLERATAEISSSRYAKAVEERLYGYIAEDEGIFEWAPCQLVYDSPDKGVRKRAANARSIATPLAESFKNAKNEAVIISPYFVPLKSGIDWLREIRSRGVDVTIVTNSLAANNQFLVHSGYAPSRKPLLESGVTIYEMRPDTSVTGTEFVDASGARATLHTKAYVVDRKELFVGSFNFDPRSVNLNTEVGVIIYDPELGERLARRVEETHRESAYEVFLNDDGKVRWRAWNDGTVQILDREPETSWWLRFKARFVGFLPIKRQL
jgi:putative cardiolipin synthase